MNVTSLLDSTASNNPSKAAYIDEMKSLTFAIIIVPMSARSDRNTYRKYGLKMFLKLCWKCFPR